MKLRWRWGAPVALVMILMVDSAQSQANEPEQPRRGFITFPTCANSGTCVDATCNERGRYLAIGGVVVDLARGGRLWQRGFGPQGNFAAAEAYCSSLVIHGLRGWRLPTNPEMGTIVLRPLGLGGRPDACVPSLDQAAFSFPDPTGLLAFWTSTGGGTLPIRLVREFSDGRSPRAYEDDTEVWVRCVHDPLF
jgi:hypothetical protein